MFALSVISLFLVISSGLSRPEKDYIEPEYLDRLLANEQYELFAKVMNIPVDFVRPNEDARSENPMFNKELPMGDIMPVFEGSEEESRQGLRFDNHPGSKWRNGYIPYHIATSQYSSSQLQTINDAIDSWNDRVGCLKLRPRRRERDYVYVFNGNGCYSYLGRIGGQQELSLQRNGCVSKGTVLHEFEHAAGFAHEHNRLDRDDHVEVLWENIPDEWHSQYEKTNPNDYGIQKNYDYYSIMHYPMGAPDTGKDAFRILANGIDTNRIGNGDDFTQTDIDKINTLYC